MGNEIYKHKEIAHLKKGELVKIIGKGYINLLKSKNNDEYILFKVEDQSGSISTPIWEDNANYKKIKEFKNGGYVELIGTVDIYESQGRSFTNILIKEANEIEVKSLVPDSDKLKDKFRDQVSSIEDPILSNILISSLNNNKVLSNLFIIPSTMMSSYNYESGLIHQIVDTIDMIDKFKESRVLETSLDETILKFDYELLKVGAILSLLGRTYTLTIKEEDIVKTNEGILAEDLIYSRDITIEALLKTKTNQINLINKKEFENKDLKLKEINTFLAEFSKIEEELLHMVSASKGSTNFGSISTSRSKYALILSDINNLIFSRNLFARLEQEKLISGNEFIKLFNGGKVYKV